MSDSKMRVGMAASRGRLLGWVMGALTLTGAVAAEQSPVPLVVPISESVPRQTPQDSRTRSLMRAYYDAVLGWDEILLQRSEPVPGKPGCVYYGRGGHEENDIRPIGYAAFVNAFLTRVEAPGPSVARERRERMRADAIGALRYLAQGHVMGAGACLNGRQWGKQWQSAMWAYSTGMAAWLLWGDLEPELQSSLSRLVEFEADRFLTSKPKSREFLDTGAEENAWNAQILSLAGNLMPAHPHAAAWREAAMRWMYNSLSVAADRGDLTIGDNARPICEWVSTTNAHPDFTVENHGIVHVGYLKTTISMLLENAIPWMITGKAVPRACQHHTAECFEALLRSMSWDASAVYYSGNDWKEVHTQPTDVMMYGLMNVLGGDGRAAYLEEVALDYTAKLQKVEGGFFNVRRDIESGGSCATRMIAAYLGHALAGAGCRPVSARQFNREVSGVWLFEHGRVLIYRTPTSYASFSWGPKRMGLALPENGNWVVWPHFASYTGQINGQDAATPRATLKGVSYQTRSDGFSISGRLDRFKGGVQQAFAFHAFPGMTVYVENIRAKPGFGLRSRETGIVGLEYDLGKNQRKLYYRGGQLTTLGVGGDKAGVVEWESDWLNIGDRVGHVVCRTPGHRNVMRFHDEVAGSGRVPKLQEWLSLAGDPEGTVEPGWACVVTFLNQGHRETARRAKEVVFTAEPERATCKIGREEVRVDLSAVFGAGQEAE